jgi:hypothetical protein
MAFFVAGRRLVMAAAATLSTSMAQSSSSSLLTLEDSSSQQQCVVVGCCLDDCCSKGTSWDVFEEYCVANTTSRGFNGSHIANYQEGCMSRTCCDSDCCGIGTVYSDELECCVALVDSLTIITVDFIQASPDNVVLLESVHRPGDSPTIEVETSIGAVVYAVDGVDVFQDLQEGGASCDNFKDALGETNSNKLVTIPLSGKDTIIYVCVRNVLVGRCIHFYTSSPVRPLLKRVCASLV